MISENPYGVSQMVYHLTALTILGPQVVKMLIDGNYDWVLKDDRGCQVADVKKPNNLYSFFCDSSFKEIRYEIFNLMKAIGFVHSEIPNLIDFTYYPQAILAEKVLDSAHPVTIVIGGNRLSKKHGTYNTHKSVSNMDSMAQLAYGSNSHEFSFQDDVITISVDHRDRPQICANVLSFELWLSVDFNMVQTIYVAGEGFANVLKPYIPEEFHYKIKSDIIF